MRMVNRFFARRATRSGVMLVTIQISSTKNAAGDSGLGCMNEALAVQARCPWESRVCGGQTYAADAWHFRGQKLLMAS
ncbi:hypothetical protein MTX26_27625 [Bradyrhizobium sp. ISRA443]|uniref:hypothetical protein n=1 Tax=unclassified Bradyrhizobium TaxID=2631580 RepID=UPI00247918DC|nr:MULTISPECIES: hypothetical protein [unclassified Bradyrhizobium]WGR93490.1 hypothetical protein MTX20_02480 [Bradyrhizobium sp. ISRA435]WGR98039.1 hypothetical protein MTX23_27615 [Bradyrhizobium sp. ISRA436]WGS04928.1 hypothetical protein MTX18_27620 [Bradyrhizobium sp. ISRA437]WGS11812.1 hypothetical protein MTX26_27625 [Bradyrhizobium sp. ISRA443]